jgi:hypothetical protein
MTIFFQRKKVENPTQEPMQQNSPLPTLQRETIIVGGKSPISPIQKPTFVEKKIDTKNVVSYSTAQAPQAKRGRPTKEEVLKREKDRLDRENQLKDQLIQQAAISQDILEEDSRDDISESTEDKKSPVSTNVPIFKVGEFVKENNPYTKYSYKGMVSRQDVGMPKYVLVMWKDGSKQWHAADSLIRITQKEWKRRDDSE